MSTQDIKASHEDGKRVRATGEPYEVWSDDSPVTLAFWDGYYGRPLIQAKDRPTGMQYERS